MANERLRAALARNRLTVSGFAGALTVDPKTVERWITKDRTPHRKTAIAAAGLIKEDPGYLWPDFGSRVVSDETHGEVVTVYTGTKRRPQLSVALPAPGREGKRRHTGLRWSASSRS